MLDSKTTACYPGSQTDNTVDSVIVLEDAVDSIRHPDKQTSKFLFKTAFARRLPDPVLPGVNRHILVVPVRLVPSGLPFDPNPRAPNIDRGIWREIRKHLLNEDGSPNTFHLKNKGVTLIASKVERLNDDTYSVVMKKGDGIVDGGHTYSLLVESLDEIAKRFPDDEIENEFSQFVKFEVLTGIESDLASEIAGGLNTAIQVQSYSLASLRNGFDWIKDELKGETYSEAIAFHENDEGPMDVRDALVMLDLFNVHLFPNDMMMEHPVRAYSSKTKVLEVYLKNEDAYKSLRPILNDILRLHDIVRLEARDKHNEAGGRGGKLAFVEQRQRGVFEFPFTGASSMYRLHRAALLPMLAGFRWMVKLDSDGLAQWDGGFDEVRSVWNACGSSMMRATQETSEENKRKVHAIGRSRNHWSGLHTIVAKTQLMRR